MNKSKLKEVTVSLDRPLKNHTFALCFIEEK